MIKLIHTSIPIQTKETEGDKTARIVQRRYLSIIMDQFRNMQVKDSTVNEETETASKTKQIEINEIKPKLTNQKKKKKKKNSTTKSKVYNICHII